MYVDDTLLNIKNKPGNSPLSNQGNKKAAPLGAAVIATLNHITGLTLHGPILGGMG